MLQQKSQLALDRLKQRQETVKQKNLDSMLRMQEQEARNLERKRQDKMNKDQRDAIRNDRKAKDWEERERARIDRN